MNAHYWRLLSVILDILVAIREQKREASPSDRPTA